jgi:hypothetical protein
MWKISKKILLLIAVMVASSQAWAQCGVTMSCGTNTTGPIGTPTTPVACEIQACFETAAALQQYEKQNNCKFANDALCGDKPLDKSTQCCGKDAITGKAKSKDRQITALDPKFDWDTYKKQCTAMRQSEAAPDALWAACEVGKKHSAEDDWPVKEVIGFTGKPNARTFCVDGCSTPPLAISAAFRAEVFLVRDKDNPTGHPSSSFYEACKAHDICYQSCTSDSQLACDTKLRDQSRLACQRIPPDAESTITTFGIGRQVNTRSKCVNAADKMFNILSDAGLGKAAFNLRRQQMCQCC